MDHGGPELSQAVEQTVDSVLRGSVRNHFLNEGIGIPPVDAKVLPGQMFRFLDEDDALGSAPAPGLDDGGIGDFMLQAPQVAEVLDEKGPGMGETAGGGEADGFAFVQGRLQGPGIRQKERRGGGKFFEAVGDEADDVVAHGEKMIVAPAPEIVEEDGGAFRRVFLGMGIRHPSGAIF